MHACTYNGALILQWTRQSRWAAAGASLEAPPPTASGVETTTSSCFRASSFRSCARKPWFLARLAARIYSIYSRIQPNSHWLRAGVVSFLWHAPMPGHAAPRLPPPAAVPAARTAKRRASRRPRRRRLLGGACTAPLFISSLASNQPCSLMIKLIRWFTIGNAAEG